MTAEPHALPRRFYKTASIAEEGGAYLILLDGRPVKTPAGRRLDAPTEALAALVAEEWEAQGESIDPDTMPATRLVNVAIDRAEATRQALADEIASYAGTDLVCYLAEDDLELARREEAAWGPLRAWAGEALGVALEPVAGVIAREQPDASLAAARARAVELDDIGLVALAHATALLGSAVIAFALLHARLDAVAAFEASRVDESHQESRWGVDAEAAARAARLGEELAATEKVMRARLPSAG
ncbi:MAG: ATP12 family protein [Maricaulaceae bacterium]|jgi:chaperone required for assembly of F1-ATPase